MKFVVIEDLENDEKHVGFLSPDGNVICSCCGGLIEEDDIGDGKTHKIIEEFDEVTYDTLTKFFKNIMDEVILGLILN